MDKVKYVIKNYLDMSTLIKLSSNIEKDNSLKAQDRILEINKKLNSNVYINAIGGQELYNREIFAEFNIELNFIKTLPYEYKQFNNAFIPNLSIIDILMFNSKEEVRELLNQYELI